MHQRIWICSRRMWIHFVSFSWFNWIALLHLESLAICWLQVLSNRAIKQDDDSDSHKIPFINSCENTFRSHVNRSTLISRAIKFILQDKECHQPRATGAIKYASSDPGRMDSATRILQKNTLLAEWQRDAQTHDDVQWFWGFSCDLRPHGKKTRSELELSVFRFFFLLLRVMYYGNRLIMKRLLSPAFCYYIFLLCHFAHGVRESSTLCRAAQSSMKHARSPIPQSVDISLF